MSTPQPQNEKDKNHKVDPAALWSAAVAAVIALAVGEGRWGWLSSGIGIVLSLLVAAYYRPGKQTENRWDRPTRAAAFGGIAGLLGAMIASGPIQAIFFNCPHECSNANLYPTKKEIDNCAGNAAGVAVGWTWLGATLLLGWLHWRLTATRTLGSTTEEDVSEENQD
ncbi:hypothetical protein ACIQI7_33765 [Kitasatospora sp. NPDC092039]|uniref:hypothetical protein n=1 Tax=Kitasatospora sp. NPDC092039 TaxID=3364086 RepID=UPI0038125008